MRVIAEQGPGAVVIEDVPEPQGDLIVGVRAAAISFPDVLMSEGRHQLRQKLPFTLGWEAAGDVLKAPAGGAFAIGDRVMTLSLGALAERVAAVPETTYALPAALSYEQGAAIPLNYLTALAALEFRGELQAGERVLVHGAAGGLGCAVVQVAKAIGARVVAVVSSEAKAQVARAAGADCALIGERFREQLCDPVDLIVDPVGGSERFKESLRALAPFGRLIVVGFAGGEIPELRVNSVLLRNVDVRGCSFFILTSDQARNAQVAARLTELIRSGALRPLLGPVRAFDEARAALRDLAERRATGKLIVRI